MLAGAVTVLLLLGLGAERLVDVTNPIRALLVFAWLIVAILWAAIGVMRHADYLAHQLGEPLGTLILTLSAISIEVSLMAALIFHGDANPTLARDTMYAVLMIIMNGLVGLTLLVGALRHRLQDFNLEGARSFMAVLLPLATVTLVLPNYTMSTEEPTLSPAQGALFALFTLFLYGVFLTVQTRRHRTYFEQPARESTSGATVESTLGTIAGKERPRNLLYHSGFLFLTLLPVPILAESLAAIVEDGMVQLNTPVALAGVLIAALVLAPEGMSAVTAAWENRLQRSVNILFGSALSTIALTIPAVLMIGLFTGRSIILGLEAEDVVLLVLTLLLSMITFGGTRTDLLKGAVHIVLFGVFIVLVIIP